MILLLYGLATILSPFCPNFIIYYLFGFISGLGAGTLDTVQTVWLIEMWDETSGSILQLSESTFGLGCFIGPLIVEQYVKGPNILVNHKTKHLILQLSLSQHISLAISSSPDLSSSPDHHHQITTKTV